MYIWLKGTRTEAMGALEKVFPNGLPPGVNTHPTSGELYIAVSSLIEPSSAQPARVPEELISRVTWEGEIVRGLRTEGLYTLGGAQLTVRTRVIHGRNEQGDTREEVQVLSISAPTVVGLREIHSQFRCGNLPPAQNWEGEQLRPQLPPKPWNYATMTDAQIREAGRQIVLESMSILAARGNLKSGLRYPYTIHFSYHSAKMPDSRGLIIGNGECIVVTLNGHDGLIHL